jgi:DNA polymerase III delta prime subunit
VALTKDNPNLKDRIVSAAPVEDDSSFELKLRPQRLNEFIGQAKVKENLSVAIEAARSRGEALDHVLLYGPPGLGKTTLANIIANELGVAFQQTSGPTLQIKGDLTAILTNLRDKQVLFIDEVHRLQPALEETCIRPSKITSRHHDRARAVGAHAHHGRQALHLHQGDYAGRPVVGAVALAFRPVAAAGVLFA